MKYFEHISDIMKRIKPTVPKTVVAMAMILFTSSVSAFNYPYNTNYAGTYTNAHKVVCMDRNYYYGSDGNFDFVAPDFTLPTSANPVSPNTDLNVNMQAYLVDPSDDNVHVIPGYSSIDAQLRFDDTPQTTGSANPQPYAPFSFPNAGSYPVETCYFHRDSSIHSKQNYLTSDLVVRQINDAANAIESIDYTGFAETKYVDTSGVLQEFTQESFVFGQSNPVTASSTPYCTNTATCEFNITNDNSYKFEQYAIFFKKQGSSTIGLFEFPYTSDFVFDTKNLNLSSVFDGNGVYDLVLYFTDDTYSNLGSFDPFATGPLAFPNDRSATLSVYLSDGTVSDTDIDDATSSGSGSGGENPTDASASSDSFDREEFLTSIDPALSIFQLGSVEPYNTTGDIVLADHEIRYSSSFIDPNGYINGVSLLYSSDSTSCKSSDYVLGGFHENFFDVQSTSGEYAQTNINSLDTFNLIRSGSENCLLDIRLKFYLYNGQQFLTDSLYSLSTQTISVDLSTLGIFGYTPSLPSPPNDSLLKPFVDGVSIPFTNIKIGLNPLIGSLWNFVRFVFDSIFSLVPFIDDLKNVIAPTVGSAAVQPTEIFGYPHTPIDFGYTIISYDANGFPSNVKDFVSMVLKFVLLVAFLRSIFFSFLKK